MRTDPKPLFLLPCACCIMRLGREKRVSSFLLLGSARTVAVIPTRITGNMKSVSRSTPQVCYLLGFFFFFLFVFNDTNLALLPGAFWLSTRKQRSRGASVLEAGCVLGGRTARAGQTQTCAGSPEGLCCHAAVL